MNRGAGSKKGWKCRLLSHSTQSNRNACSV